MQMTVCISANATEYARATAKYLGRRAPLWVNKTPKTWIFSIKISETILDCTEC